MTGSMVVGRQTWSCRSPNPWEQGERKGKREKETETERERQRLTGPDVSLYISKPLVTYLLLQGHTVSNKYPPNPSPTAHQMGTKHTNI